MQEPGRRPAPQFAGVDLRRPKGYPAPAAKEAEEKEQAPAAGDPCPRCESRDTKFCYYNNYNTSQPRHFCKSCRRYWTKGGSLRNVPVGGGTRKGSSSSSSSSSPATPKSPKRSKNSKRRRVAPAPDTTPSTDASTAIPTAADTAAAPATSTEEAAATVSKEETAGSPATDGGSKGTSVALGSGFTYVAGGGKELPDLGQFEWPSSCDQLGSFWGTTMPPAFTDTDPALFLNLP